MRKSALIFVVVAFISAACIPRDSDSVVLTQEETVSGFGQSWEVDFYRNPAYSCGLSGSYTFLVMNPADDPNAEAPLLVYLHGGGTGYYDDQGVYITVVNQTEDTFNHEETFDDLWDAQVLRRVVDDNGQLLDSTLTRRIEEGYRLLVVSMCDHDLFSGLGTPYPNNPGREVNGLQATLAALDYTVANYSTTHVFGYGTSAGSPGVYSLASSLATEGNPLTGMVADSYIVTPRLLPGYDAFSGQPGYPFGSDYDEQGVTDKVGFFADLSVPVYPEARVNDGFADVPMLFIAGDDDPFCGGNQLPLAEAVADGMSNCNWLFDGLRQAVAGQPNSPHQVNVVDNAGHVPTHFAGPALDIVDNFIADILATNPPAFGSE